VVNLPAVLSTPETSLTDAPFGRAKALAAKIVTIAARNFICQRNEPLRIKEHYDDRLTVTNNVLLRTMIRSIALEHMRRGLAS